MAPLRLWHAVPLCLALALPLASSQPPLPSPSQCVAGAAPCTYAGECRSQSGVCGDTVMHCNANSVWVPACGGGGGLVKPAPAPAVSPTNRPIVPPQPQTAPEPPPTDSLASSNEEPSSRPTTNWEGWLAKNDPANQGVVGLTTGKEGEEEEYVASNATGGFNPDSWGYREEEEEGWLDGIGFLNSAANRRTWKVAFLASAAAVGAVLS